ncbi:hypothetical protein ACFL5H_02755 [Candidatus Latescibacterota bacterium]
MDEHVLKGRPDTREVKSRAYTGSKIDDFVWDQVLKVAEKNADFKSRLRALGMIENDSR